MIRHYYFTELETGEEFIVGAEDLTKAYVIAFEVGADIGSCYNVKPYVMYEYEMTEWEADVSGLDEYRRIETSPL
jgi:hypothetical protein